MLKLLEKCLKNAKIMQKSCWYQQNLAGRGSAKFIPWNNFMATFYGWGSTSSRLQPRRGGNLLSTTEFPEIPGTHFIDLERIKSWAVPGAT